jgi:SSS family solute:Na+ symporter
MVFLLSSFALAAAFVAVGVFAGRGVRAAGEFVLAGRRASAVGVSGVLLGALVGGASTIGTAEMAYRHGLSALWFTLGAGIGCAVLGLLLAGPLRRAQLETIPQFLTLHYGRPVGLVALAGSVAGSFLSVAAQVLSAAALVRVLVPLEIGWAAATVAALVLGFLIAGGLKSFAALGAAKVVLLYLVLVACAVRAVGLGATPGHLWATLPSTPYLTIFAGARDAGAAVSVMVGVLCTQIYVQGIFAASSEGTARTGALVSAALMPPLGLLGVWIGLAVRAEGVEIPAAQALPWFIHAHFPPAVAGMMWTTLLLTAVGTAAGLVLGIATNLVRDVYSP